MQIAVLKESYPHEQRVALSPDVAKKIIELGHSITIQKDAGKASGFLDEMYEKNGCSIEKDTEKLLKKADIILTVSPLEENLMESLKKGTILIGMLKPYMNKDKMAAWAKKGITTISLELVPRITRAQSMDVLSSQSNLAGYKAVIEGANAFGRVLPLMMTAAGTVPAARVLVLGAGVAGLQAIATAKRLGAIVSAFDVRAAAKEQVESLGATFISVEANESGEGTGGYAKEMSADYKKAQADKLADTIKNQDIVITTAQIPGKPAPTLITEAMVKSMKPGSVIVDLAVETGGNCPLSQLGKTVVKNNVSIMGPANMASQVPTDASQLYAKNVLNYLKNMLSSDGKEIVLNLEDEIIKNSILTHEGKIIHPNFV